MKTKHFLAAMVALLMMVSTYTQAQNNLRDEPNAKVPGHPGIKAPTLGYLITDDNENNAHTGVPDFDMDAYLFNDDYRAPIEFNFFVTDATVTTAQLSILAYDIDWANGEVDKVYVNGNYVGDLTGVNGTWSTSVFSVNPAWINPISANGGKNLVIIDIDVNNPPPYSSWAVQVDWGQLNINNTTGNATFRYVNLDKLCYTGGQCIQVTQEVDAVTPMNVRVETYLLDPANNAILQENRTFLATSGNEPFTIPLCLPATPNLGTWNVRTIIYDVATNVQQDIKTEPLVVSLTCSSIPTLTEWGLIILGLTLLAFGTFYIVKMRG